VDGPYHGVTEVDVSVCTPSELNPVSLIFTQFTVGQVGTLVRSGCIAAGVTPRDSEDLLIAVSEIVTNAIRYAGGGSITVRRVAGGLLTVVCDSGPGLPDSLMIGRLASEATEWPGLWLARLMCNEFDIASSPSGVTVRMFTPCRAAAGSPAGSGRLGSAEPDDATMHAGDTKL
jgi:anti-sigma regulatory factor (Ser/Thr protein kinase)